MIRALPSRLLSRRHLLHSAALLGLGGCGLDLQLASSASYDDVLAAIDQTDFELGTGSNHAPMAADALVAGGRAERVADWVERYASRLKRVTTTGIAIAPADRAAALGVYERRFDWVATFVAELETRSPSEVLAQAWALLGQGYFAAGWHGFLRAAHAYRALTRQNSAARRLEFAHGLAFWAARFEALPGTAGASARTGFDVVSALRAVPLVPDHQRKPDGFIAEQVGVVRDLPSFAAAIDAVDLQAHDLETSLTDLAAAAARLYVNDGSNDIVLLHAVTGTSALKLVLATLEPTAQREALGVAFRAVAAAYAVKGHAASAFDAVPAATESADALLDRALARDDEHDIKLVEACVREARLGGPPEFLAAAQRRLR